MERKFSLGVQFIYPEAKYTFLSKFIVKALGAGAGQSGAGLMMDGVQVFSKSIFGGVPVKCQLYINNHHLKISPPSYADIFVENIKEIIIPRSEIVNVKRKVLYLLSFQNLITVTLRTGEIKFMIDPLIGSPRKIADTIKKLT